MASNYRVFYSRDADKKLAKLHPIDREKLIKALHSLTDNPFDNSLNIKKLTSTQSFYRLRVGKTRAVYFLDSKEKRIWVIRAGYRGDIY